jgi:Tubulin like
MKIYQPMLYVGLGGTGCHIGEELERRLRAELCGPDGTDLQDVLAGMDYLPYQLPSCLQFVYADLNEAELSRLRRRVVPSDVHLPAAARTAHFIHDLVPRHNTYPEVARSLRLNAEKLVSDWLPPIVGEPKVAPLVKGAGQLPTVGRAALFETFRGGLGPAQRPIIDAIGQISKSAPELMQLGGELRGSIDVFIAFSVAGGTGGGIFLDYLHLIGDALSRAGYRAQIYPLVVMPSAFEEGMGGGRPARLNAGRALLDLFRLVDDQNGRAAQPELGGFGQADGFAVRYPHGGETREIRLPPTTVQTGFLFSRTAGVERDDLHRSIVALMLSLVGTEEEQADSVIQAGDRLYQSFADDFINRGVDRQLPAESGLGGRGVSTSLVASMTVPVDDLAEAVSSRMLAAAVMELSVPPPGTAESNRKHIEDCFTLANVDELRTRPPLDFTEPALPRKGTDAVTRALRSRIATMESSLYSLDQKLAKQVPTMAQDFDPRRAAEQLLTEVDLFRMERIMLGHRELRDPAEQQGFLGLLEDRRGEPKPPPNIAITPPQPGELRGRLLRRTQWTDKVVRDAIEQQNAWFAWRAKRAWHAAWSAQTGQWDRRAAELRRQLVALRTAFTEHAQSDPSRFARRAQELYRPRTGVSYLMPPQGNDLEPFYQAVLRRFVSYYVARDRLRPVATAADVVHEIVGAQTWQRAFRANSEGSSAQAVEVVRDKIKQEVLRLFRHQEPGERPLVPGLADLVAAAAGKEQGINLGEDDVAQFRQKLAGLVPGGFTPQGSGQLKILISYAAFGHDPQIEAYLGRELNLDRTADTILDFRPIEAESIVVVQFRTSMSITEVPELREVMRNWAEAIKNEHTQDYLRWRQRIGYDYSYLISTEEHRVHVLHRLLCALWNRQVEADGRPESPRRLVVRLGGRDSTAMTLPLTSFDRTSSWGSLLPAYEEWTIAGDESIRRDFGRRLMSILPTNLDLTPAPPGQLYVLLVRTLAGEQQRLLTELIPKLPDRSRGRAETLLAFWSQTLPAALDLPFSGSGSPVRATLRDLQEAYLPEAAMPAPAPAALEPPSGTVGNLGWSTAPVRDPEEYGR